MNRIREIREKAEISQASLHRSLGWRQSRIANYESGKRTPGLNEARDIVAALNALGARCTLGEVFPEPNPSAFHAPDATEDRRKPLAAHEPAGRRATDLSADQARQVVDTAEQLAEVLRPLAEGVTPQSHDSNSAPVGAPRDEEC